MLTHIGQPIFLEQPQLLIDERQTKRALIGKMAVDCAATDITGLDDVGHTHRFGTVLSKELGRDGQNMGPVGGRVASYGAFA